MPNVMESRWRRLKNLLDDIYPEIVSDLNDGCNQDQINEIEKEINLKLPQPIRDFYLIHNGQRTEDFLGMFYGVSFLPLNKVAEEWRGWQEIVAEINYEEREGKVSILNEFQQSLVPNYLKAKYINNKWIPFATIYDNSYLGLDFDPEPIGKIGQIINFGRDEEQKSVIADSFELFIDWYINELERGNFLIEEDKHGKSIIPKELQSRFLRGGSPFLGAVATRFIT